MLSSEKQDRLNEIKAIANQKLKVTEAKWLISTLEEEMQRNAITKEQVHFLKQNLLVAKKIQNMLSPLFTDLAGHKTTGGNINRNAEIFSYYKGINDLSGDYIDFRKLSDTLYSAINCHVNGNDISAALLTAIVATTYSLYFRNFHPGLTIDQLVYEINTSLEEKGFSVDGRFANMTTALINVLTGESFFVGAGKESMHIYRASQGRMLEQKLPSAPAIGALPSELITAQKAYKVESTILQAGDCLFFFTNGMQESNRIIHDSTSNNKSIDSEYFGFSRIYEIIDAVFNRRHYKLVRHPAPTIGEELSFDFRESSGSLSEAIFALASVEKVFRLVPDPVTRKEDYISVDTEMNNFLLRYFDQYKDYFARRIDSNDNSGNICFTNIKEDIQCGDILILAIRKK